MTASDSNAAVRLDARGDVVVGGDVVGRDKIVGYTVEQVGVLLTQISATFQPKPFDGRSPYKGLDAFDEADADRFFGREALVAELVQRLAGSRFLVVAGPSGTGKSSLLRAGLLTALRRGALPASDTWRYATLTPGREPLERLALGLSRLTASPETGDYVRRHIHDEPAALERAVEAHLSDNVAQSALILVDQFEEIFNPDIAERERVTFINALVQAGTRPGGRILTLWAMRSDFVAPCAAYPQLNDLLGRQFLQVGAMQAEELVSAVARPALQVGLRIDPDLVAQVVNDMHQQPGALPLMQFALTDLFESQRAKGGLIALTLDDYLARGGLHRALERYGDGVFATLTSAEQVIARALFTGLVDARQSSTVTRRTARLDELTPPGVPVAQVEAVVARLADARLITTDVTADGVRTATVAHERLIEAWPWLRKLVHENREAIALQNEVAFDAQDWDEHGREASYLYVGAKLASVEELVASGRMGLSARSRAFVDAGVAARHADEGRRRRLRRALIAGLVTLVAGLTGVAIALTALSWWALTAQQQALSAKNTALARQLAAQAQVIFAQQPGRLPRGILLAIESLRRYPEGGANQLLSEGLDLLPHELARVSQGPMINDLAFSPDGARVVSVSNDGTALVWEASTGHEVARLSHDAEVRSAAFSPDGRRLVTGSWDDTARVWEIESGRELARTTHDSAVSQVAFHPDGRWVLSAGDDGITRIWDAASGLEVASFSSEFPITDARFSPDGQRVASADLNGDLWVWQTATGVEIAHMRHDSFISDVAFSPDSRWLASGSWDATARVWDAETGEEITRIQHGSTVNAVSFSPDGGRVLSASVDLSVRVWEAFGGNELARMLHASDVMDARFSPDGSLILSGSDDGTARLWDAATGREIALMAFDEPVGAVAFSPDGARMAASGTGGVSRVWELATGPVVARVTHDGWIGAAAFSPDGQRVVSAGQDGVIHVWEPVTGADVMSVEVGKPVNAAVFSPDGRRLITGGLDNAVRVWEVAAGVEIVTIELGTLTTDLDVSADGRRVAAAGFDETVRVWNADTGVEIASLTADGTVEVIDLSPDGRRVVAGDSFGTAIVWDVDTGRELSRFVALARWTVAAFSPDSRWVVGGDSSGGVRVWESETGREVSHMNHGDWISAAVFSHDGQRVASASADGTARVWEAATGQEIARVSHDTGVTAVSFSADDLWIVSGDEALAQVWEASTGLVAARRVHADSLQQVSFSPDGSQILSASYDGVVQVWLWQTEDLIALACGRLTDGFTPEVWSQYLGTEPYRRTCDLASAGR